MDRQDEINETATQVLNGRMQENYFKICSYYNDHKKEILSDFKHHISCVVDQAYMQQEKQGKRPIRYVAASFLLSSTITESYDFQISLMDDQNFLDPIECCIYWSPKWIFVPVKDDRATLISMAKKEHIRLHTYELDSIWRAYVCGFYYNLAGLFFAENLKKAAIAGGLEKLNLAQEVQFVFGGIMDRFAVIDTWGGKCENEIFPGENGSTV